MLFIMYAHTQHVYLKVKWWSLACHESIQKGGHTAPCTFNKSCSVFTWFLEVDSTGNNTFCVVYQLHHVWAQQTVVKLLVHQSFVSSDHKGQSKYEYYDLSDVNLWTWCATKNLRTFTLHSPFHGDPRNIIISLQHVLGPFFVVWSYQIHINFFVFCIS